MPQVIKKRRIVLASVLKPVDETRMFEKIGVSLYDSGAFEVSIIGYQSEASITHPGIKFYPLYRFNRLGFGRLRAQWDIFKKINEVKPELIIINTPELLIVAILNKVFFGRKIIYDVLENYYRNIRFTSVYPFWLRPLLSALVRLIEITSAPLVNRFLLAEAGYQQELGFVKSPTIIQNKLPKTISTKFINNVKRGYPRLVFSGTIAKSTGVFEAIRLCKQLHQLDQAYTLTIIGYCTKREELDELKNEINDFPFIKLIGGNYLVPHGAILEQLSIADRGVIIYPANPSTQSSIPTKLYEYLALQLPILILHNEESHRMVQEYKAGIVLCDFPDIQELSTALKTQSFAPTVSDSIYWESDVKRLMDCLNTI